MSTKKMTIHRASPEEMAMIISAHPPAGGAWSLLVLRAASEGGLLVATEGADRLGYLVLDNTSFFATGFVWLLYVNEEHRRRGVGSALMRRAAAVCHTSDLYTSTHGANKAMMGLLSKLGWSPSGRVDNLNAEGAEDLYHIDGHGERDNGRSKPKRAVTQLKNPKKLKAAAAKLKSN